MCSRDEFIGMIVIDARPDGGGGFTTITLGTLFGKKYVVEAFNDGRGMAVDEVK